MQYPLVLAAVVLLVLAALRVRPSWIDLGFLGLALWAFSQLAGAFGW